MSILRFRPHCIIPLFNFSPFSFIPKHPPYFEGPNFFIPSQFFLISSSSSFSCTTLLLLPFPFCFFCFFNFLYFQPCLPCSSSIISPLLPSTATLLLYLSFASSSISSFSPPPHSPLPATPVVFTLELSQSIFLLVRWHGK